MRVKRTLVQTLASQLSSSFDQDLALVFETLNGAENEKLFQSLFQLFHQFISGKKSKKQADTENSESAASGESDIDDDNPCARCYSSVHPEWVRIEISGGHQRRGALLIFS